MSKGLFNAFQITEIRTNAICGYILGFDCYTGVKTKLNFTFRCMMSSLY